MWAPIRRRARPALPAAPSRRAFVHTPAQARALRAAGMRVELGPRDAAKALVKYRQPWQEEALDYRETVGELDYATRLQENTVKRVRFLSAAYTPDSDTPVPVEDSEDARYADAAHEALGRLGDAGTVAKLAAKTMGALKVPGECYLVGRTDDGDGVAREVWEVRSISEIGVVDDKPVLLDAPKSRDGITLGSGDFIARLWNPSGRFQMYADSPVRAAISTCLDALVLLSKEVSASASSRLASAGLLLLDDRLIISRADGPEAADSAEDDPLMSVLIEAGTAAIRDPGSAEAALPILLRGPAEAIKESKHMTFARPAEDNKDKREWLLRRLATTLDLPAELILGQADVNHWGLWLLDDTKWRDYMEPGVQDVVLSWTDAYYRHALSAAGVPEDVVARQVVWYDPTEVIVKSDRSQAATEAWDRNELSGEAYRAHVGFTEDEAPTPEELLVRAALRTGIDPASALMVLTGRDVVQLVPAPAAEPREIEPAPDDEESEQGPPNGGDAPPPPGDEGDAPMSARAMSAHVAARRAQLALVPGRRALVAAGAVGPAEALAISQALAQLDAQLRTRLRDACEGAVRDVLERAGGRVANRARTSRDPAVVAALAGNPPAWRVPSLLGPALTAASAGEERLISAVLAELAVLWERWVDPVRDQVLRRIARLCGVDVSAVFAQVDGRFREDVPAGWAFLSGQVEKSARAGLLSDPSEAVERGRLVPAAVPRAALAIAGGFDTPSSRGLDPDTLLPVDRREHFGQIGTGTTVKNVAEKHGAALERFQWIHGFAENPFEPHLRLDRKFFDSFEGPELEHEGFPVEGGGRGHLRPGDHSGCSCDLVLVWTPPEKQGE